MDIPKTFSLGAINWTVEETPNLYDTVGLCCRDAATIVLLNTLPEQVKAQTFAHELVHAILFSMGQTQHDEVFVDGFGTFLHQFLETFE